MSVLLCFNFSFTQFPFPVNCCFLVLTARDASVRGRLDGGGEGGIPNSLPLGEMWGEPRGPGYLQRTSGPEQQIRRLLLQAQRYYGAECLCSNRGRSALLTDL